MIKMAISNHWAKDGLLKNGTIVSHLEKDIIGCLFKTIHHNKLQMDQRSECQKQRGGGNRGRVIGKEKEGKREEGRKGGEKGGEGGGKRETTELQKENMGEFLYNL